MMKPSVKLQDGRGAVPDCFVLGLLCDPCRTEQEQANCIGEMSISSRPAVL